MISHNRKVEPQKREEKKEIAEWFPHLARNP